MSKYYSTAINEIVNKELKRIIAGEVRNHKLGNEAEIHSGEQEEKECCIYRDFLPTKNCDFIINLRGSDLYEQY